MAVPIFIATPVAVSKVGARNEVAAVTIPVSETVNSVPLVPVFNPPRTSSLAPGFVVPMPTLPLEFTNKPEAGAVPPRSHDVPFTSSLASGLVVPIPTLPPVKKAEKAAFEKVDIPVNVLGDVPDWV